MKIDFNKNNKKDMKVETDDLDRIEQMNDSKTLNVVLSHLELVETKFRLW